MTKFFKLENYKPYKSFKQLKLKSKISKFYF